jgi:hypothetical protein
VTSFIPIGTIMPFWVDDLPDDDGPNLWGPEPPAGWVWCDGSPHGGPEELTAMIGPNSPDLRDRSEYPCERFLMRVKP